jgi:hypothetical protein
MPCIWGQHNGSQLLLSVAILPALTGIIQGAPYNGEVVAVKALVDTGATTTAISQKHAARIKLQPVGKVPIQGVGGIQNHNSYLFLVAFPFALPPGVTLAGLPPPGPGQVQGQIQVLERAIQGCDFPGGSSADFQVILGMDVLRTGSLVVQGNNTFSFSF